MISHSCIVSFFLSILSLFVDSGRPKGFGFVEFEDEREAQDAIYGLDRRNFGGRPLNVCLAREGRKRPEEMRGRGGNDGGRRRQRSRSRERRGGRRDRDRRGRSRSRSRERSRRGRSPSGDRGGKERATSRSRSPGGGTPTRKEGSRSRSPARRVSRSRSPTRSGGDAGRGRSGSPPSLPVAEPMDAQRERDVDDRAD